MRHRWVYVLLLVPFVALLWVGSYAHDAPRLGGFPFFYWYQFLWVLLGAGVTWFVYAVTTRREEAPGEEGAPYPVRTAGARADERGESR